MYSISEQVTFQINTSGADFLVTKEKVTMYLKSLTIFQLR